MHAKLLVLFCVVCAVCAYPNDPNDPRGRYDSESASQQLSRARRDDERNKPTPSPYKPEEPAKWPQLEGEGGGNRKDGYNVHLNARVPVWESENKRHSVDAVAGYGQHLGGQWGSSQPVQSYGGVYKYRW